MTMLHRLAICSLLLAAAPLALAVRPIEAPAPARPGAVDTGPVERGGTIESLDLQKQAIVIEGVSYMVPVGSMPIHWPANRVTGQWRDLKAGMQIRFSTVRDESRRQHQLREIWVTRMATAPAR